MFTYNEYDFYIEVSTSANYHALFTKKYAGNFSFSNPTKSASFTQLCRKSFIETMKFDPYSVLTVKLIHSDKYIEQHVQHSIPVYNRFSILSKADAIITSNKDLVPTITFADCIPAAIIDPTNSIHVALHAGWKGIFTEIMPKTITCMINHYNSKPENLEIVVGPSISVENYEVQQDFVDYLHKYKIFKKFKDSLIEKESASSSLEPISNNKKIQYFFDNRNALKNQLKQCRISDEQVFWIDIDTYSDERYSSYRKNNKDFTAQALLVYKR